MRKFLLAQFILCLFAFPLLAQNRAITGKITSSEDGSTLPGVTVLIKGTNQGTTTNADGSFQINAAKGATLQISFIGFATQSVTLDNQTTVNLALKPDASQLQEIVVTAQGIRKNQREIGYAISKVSTEDVTVGRSPQLAQALAGKVTGLAVYNVNNSVDPAVKIVLRGYRSLTGNNEALVVLDGMQTTSTILSTINPNDIESVSILKGGQAATLYGSSGINGALIITTKEGRKRQAESKLFKQYELRADQLSCRKFRTNTVRVHTIPQHSVQRAIKRIIWLVWPTTGVPMKTSSMAMPSMALCVFRDGLPKMAVN